MIDHALRIGVTEAVGLGTECALSGSLWSPAPDLLADEALLLVAVPGGTYPRTYWHHEVPGRTGYSFAQDMSDRGHLVLSFDNLGTGESTRPTDAGGIDFEVVADANVSAARQVADQLRAGTLSPRMPALPGLRMVGVGHSMGGQLTAVAQARHQVFERTAILGSSFLGNASLGVAEETNEDATGRATARMRELAPTAFDSGYLEPRRDALRPLFHAADVPADVLAADEIGQTVIVRNMAVRAIAPHTLAKYAAAIDVPVFLAFGDVDTSPDPRSEVAVYESCHDITLFLLEGSAHCHNSATTRQVLWDRLAGWLGATP